MEKDVLKRVAARCVAQGLKRAAALSGDAWRDRRLSEMMPNPDRQALRISAANKFQKAERIRQLCGRLAAAHGICPKRIRPRMAAPTGNEKKATMMERRVTHA